MSLEQLSQEFRNLQASERVRNYAERSFIDSLGHSCTLYSADGCVLSLKSMPQDLVNALSCAGDLLTDLSSVPESDKERFETFAAGYLSVIQVHDLPT